MPNSFNRRKFFASALITAPLAKSLPAFIPDITEDPRARAALELRRKSAFDQGRRPRASMIANGDEDSLPGRIACFAKGLPQGRFGQVEPAAYEALLSAIQSRRHADFERIPRGGGRRLNNPQAAFAFHLEGGDPHTFDIPLAPSITSEAAAWETSELYWQALCRDVPFSGFETSPVFHQGACAFGV